MELNFFRKTTIKELKKAFSKNFTFLKIEFFKEPHVREEGSRLQQKIADHVSVCDIAGVQKGGILSFHPFTTVAEFEQRMQTEFGLPVQVFRKTGDLWIETIQTDDMTLQEQNNKGEASSRPLRFNVNTLLL